MLGRKKKEQAQFNTMDDSRVTVYDFKRRIQCLFESYRSTDYRHYPGLSEEEMKPKLDRHLEALFSGDVDDGNGDMLDNIIFGPYRESVPYLNIQRLNHKDMNRRLVARRVSDRADFERFDFRDGEIRFRSYIDCENLLPSTTVVKNSIHCTAAMVKRYAPGILDIIFGGVKAKDAITKCEREGPSTEDELRSAISRSSPRMNQAQQRRFTHAVITKNHPDIFIEKLSHINLESLFTHTRIKSSYIGCFEIGKLIHWEYHLHYSSVQTGRKKEWESVFPTPILLNPILQSLLNRAFIVCTVIWQYHNASSMFSRKPGHWESQVFRRICFSSR